MAYIWVHPFYFQNNPVRERERETGPKPLQGQSKSLVRDQGGRKYPVKDVCDNSLGREAGTWMCAGFPVSWAQQHPGKAGQAGLAQGVGEGKKRQTRAGEGKGRDGLLAELAQGWGWCQDMALGSDPSTCSGWPGPSLGCEDLHRLNRQHRSE